MQNLPLAWSVARRDPALPLEHHHTPKRVGCAIFCPPASSAPFCSTSGLLRPHTFSPPGRSKNTHHGPYRASCHRLTG